MKRPDKIGVFTVFFICHIAYLTNIMSDAPKPKKNSGQRPLGFALLITGIILNTFTRVPSFDRMIGDDAGTWLSAIGLIFIIIGGYMVYRGGQYAAKALAQEIDDSTPIVLYLRPFKTDVKMGKYIFTQFYFGGVRTMEEQLAEVLQPFGRLLAIGQPGETLPKPGAAKIYADDDWKKVVIDKMKTSRLVVILAGTGEGLLWELKEAFEVVDPTKILILVPEMRKKSYEAFRLQAEKTFNIHFPEAGQIKTRVGLNAADGFIRFTSDWKSSFLRAKAPLSRSEPYLRYKAKFSYALQPVFESYGIEWHKPRYSVFMKIILGFGLLFLLFIVLIIVLAIFHG
jgi:hypothetical protein